MHTYKDTYVVLLAGGRGTRLDILTTSRAKPAVPIGGKYKIIDFALSNCSNSELYDVGVLTQYLPYSINKHIETGRPWDMDRKYTSVKLLQPHNEWYGGTAHAVKLNFDYVISQQYKHVLVLSGDHIYKMDYRPLIDQHIKNKAALTVCTQVVDMKEASRFGIMEVDEGDKIIGFEEKPANPKSNLASMGIYVFDIDVLGKHLFDQDLPDLDFGKHIVTSVMEQEAVYAYRYDGYWKDVGTLDSYLEANLELNEANHPLDLYDHKWKVQTRSKERPPLKVLKGASVEDSLVCNGARIYGKVINSVLSEGVIVEAGAVVKDSVIFRDTVVRANAKVERSIIDRNCIIGEGATVGFGDDLTPSKDSDVLTSGINVIGKHAHIPAKTVITRNVRVEKRVEEFDFKAKEIAPGETVYASYVSKVDRFLKTNEIK